MFDIVGDIHARLGVFDKLLETLGYEKSRGGDYRSPHGRHLILVGDLIDYGPAPLETVTLVRQLVRDGLATCLMGNHEYNFLEAWHGIKEPRTSGLKVFRLADQNREEWGPVADFFAGLPIALEFDDFRVVHAVWHEPSICALAEVLGREGPVNTSCPTLRWWESPFRDGELRADLPSFRVPESYDRPHEILMKGTEQKSEPFVDTTGKVREEVREAWWHEHHGKFTVFGHYRSLPPNGETPSFAPPAPQGTPKYVDWVANTAGTFPHSGAFSVPANTGAVCVDFEAVSAFQDSTVSLLGALRLPEREIVWTSTRSSQQ